MLVCRTLEQLKTRPGYEYLRSDIGHERVVVDREYRKKESSSEASKKSFPKPGLPGLFVREFFGRCEDCGRWFRMSGRGRLLSHRKQQHGHEKLAQVPRVLHTDFNVYNGAQAQRNAAVEVDSETASSVSAAVTNRTVEFNPLPQSMSLAYSTPLPSPSSLGLLALISSSIIQAIGRQDSSHNLDLLAAYIPKEASGTTSPARDSLRVHQLLDNLSAPSSS